MSTNRTLPAVPTPTTDPTKPRTETEEKLWQALQHNPRSTTAVLSAAAGIGKSTAPKILTRWEKDGLVARTPGIADGGSRPADHWSITTTDHDKSTDDQPTDDQPTAVTESEQQQEKSQRLAPGALRGMVEDYLRDNSGEFSPNAIGKALNRSSGAVHNALEKLVESGSPCAPATSPRSILTRRYVVGGVALPQPVATLSQSCLQRFAAGGTIASGSPVARPWVRDARVSRLHGAEFGPDRTRLGPSADDTGRVWDAALLAPLQVCLERQLGRPPRQPDEPPRP